MVEKERVIQIFEEYVSEFDASDPMIAMKIEHTHKVATLCEQIARFLKWKEEKCELAWLLGMLHDLGRFVQIREYGTFDDLRSIDHALGSIRVLFEDGYLRRFLDEDKYDDVIDTAIRYHNAFRLPTDISCEMQSYCDLLRDADKIDILRINTEFPKEAIYGKDISLAKHQEVSEKVYEEFMRESAILRSNIITQIDRIIGHVSLAFELVYPFSKQIVFENGYVEKMLKIDTENETAHEQLKLMRDKIMNYISSESAR